MVNKKPSLIDRILAIADRVPEREWKKISSDSKDEYIKKLERRIHNQRVALRENWQIMEMRAKHRRTWRENAWFCYVKKLRREINELKSR